MIFVADSSPLLLLLLLALLLLLHLELWGSLAGPRRACTASLPPWFVVGNGGMDPSDGALL